MYKNTNTLCVHSHKKQKFGGGPSNAAVVFIKRREAKKDIFYMNVHLMQYKSRSRVLK